MRTARERTDSAARPIRPAPFFSRTSATPFFAAPPIQLQAQAAAGQPAPIQRLPAGGTDFLHDQLLDEFSRETGIPRERANVHSAEYEAWSAVRDLKNKSIEQVLLELDRFAAAGQLDGLIANGRPLGGLYPREVTAMLVVRQSRGAAANRTTALATVAASGLPAADQQALNLFAQVSPVVRGPDQRRAATPAGGEAALPGADLAREIGYELEPSSRPAPAPPATGGTPPAVPPRTPWDGRDGAPDFAKHRKDMQDELFAAFDAYLTFKRPTTLARLAMPRVAFTAPSGAPAGSSGVLDIAGQAREVLEARYGPALDAGVSSAGLTKSRRPLEGAAGGSGPRLFDASSETDRHELSGSTDLASGIAWWLFENDRPGATGAAGSRRFATEILKAHNYSAQDAGAEDFRHAVASAYAAASTLAPSNERQLTEYRLTVSEADPTGSGKGFTVQSAFNPSGDRNLAELRQRWQIFSTATHESLHLRTHPAFVEARQGRGTLIEGFTEMFAISTLNTDILPKVRAGGAEPLRLKVEGTLATPKPDPAIVADRVTPGQYVGHRAQAERIRDGGTAPGGAAHPGVGEAAVRAAYFQGHVEYLGLAPDGSQLPGLPAAGAIAAVHVPAGLTGGVAELALRSGVAASQIRQDNPGITDVLPATAVLAGCRDHLVVAGENRAHIATQNGVSQADLVRANPDLARDPSTGAWPTLAAGQKILIPKH